MSLQEEIACDVCDAFGIDPEGQDYGQLHKAETLTNEAINKVLDAAVDAARTRHRGQGALKDTDSPMGWEFNAGIREAITEINKLRPEK